MLFNSMKRSSIAAVAGKIQANIPVDEYGIYRIDLKVIICPEKAGLRDGRLDFQRSQIDLKLP